MKEKRVRRWRGTPSTPAGAQNKNKDRAAMLASYSYYDIFIYVIARLLIQRHTCQICIIAMLQPPPALHDSQLTDSNVTRLNHTNNFNEENVNQIGKKKKCSSGTPMIIICSHLELLGGLYTVVGERRCICSVIAHCVWPTPTTPEL